MPEVPSAAMIPACNKAALLRPQMQAIKDVAVAKTLHDVNSIL
jgi:hypothetical protein